MSITINPTIYSSGGGLKSSITVTGVAQSGSVSCVTPKGVTKQFAWNGTAWYLGNLSDLGTYTITATEGSETKTQDLLIDVVGEYDVAITFVTIPEEYQQLTYIESTGTQCINTNILPYANYSASIDFQLNSLVGDDLMIAGLWTGSQGWRAGLMDNSLYVNSTIGGFSYTDKGSYRYIAESSACTVSNNAGVYVYLFTQGNKNRPSGHNDSCISAKLFSAKFYNGSNLVRNFIPCYRKSDGEVGLYDTVTETFFTNKGAGSFKIGGIIDSEFNATYQQVEYLKSRTSEDNDDSYTALTGLTSRVNVVMKGLVKPTGVDFKLFSEYLDSKRWYIIQTDSPSQHWRFSFGSSDHYTVSVTYGNYYWMEAEIKNNSQILKADGSQIYSFTHSISPTSAEYNVRVKNGLVYHCVIIESGEIKRLYVPCFRKSDNSIGMYDMVNHKFYENTSGNIPVIGPDIDIA